MISIVIPNYNKENFLPDTLDSLLDQSFPYWEAVVVDDHSTDGSWAILERYAQQDQRIRIFINTSGKKGASIARNFGLRYVLGKYVIFLDSDDLLAPHCLESRYSYMELQTKLDFAVFPVHIFRGQKVHIMDSWRPYQSIDPLKQFLEHALPWAVMCPIWRRTYLEQLGGFDEFIVWHEDVELHIRALLQPTVHYAAPEVEPDCFYLVSETRHNEQTFSRLEKLLEGTIRFLGKVSNLLDQYQRPGLQKYLKGTILSFLKQLHWLHVSGAISTDQERQIFNAYLQSAVLSELLSTFEIGFLRWYKKGLDCRLDRVKGYNYLSKYCFVHC